jgi:hypothetical protein
MQPTTLPSSSPSLSSSAPSRTTLCGCNCGSHDCFFRLPSRLCLVCREHGGQEGEGTPWPHALLRHHRMPEQRVHGRAFLGNNHTHTDTGSPERAHVQASKECKRRNTKGGPRALL